MGGLCFTLALFLTAVAALHRASKNMDTADSTIQKSSPDIMETSSSKINDQNPDPAAGNPKKRCGEDATSVTLRTDRSGVADTRPFDHKHILRPNPDFEEDLELHTIVTPDILARIQAYTGKYKMRKNLKPPCKCQEVRSSAGAAPLVELNDGHRMPKLGLGTWLGFTKTGSRVSVEDDAVQRAVEWAIDQGYRHIDTAFIYDTEVQVGKAVNKKIEEGVVKRSDLFITTKLWNDQHGREAVVPALRRSLANLNLTHVDLYLVHWPVGLKADGSYDPVDYLETWRGMVEAREHALARSIGISNFNQHMIDRILTNSSVKPAVLQVEINLNLQQPELLKYCRDQNIVVAGYTPFGSLFGSKGSEDAPPPRVDEPALVALADKHNKTVPQLALRYLVELGVVPLPKSLTRARILQNIDVFDFQLSAEDRDQLRSYDRHYRTIAVKNWIDSPYYPFEKN